MPCAVVDVDARGIELPPWSAALEALVLELFRTSAFEGEATCGEVSIILCDDEFIAELNLRYRDKEGATDVLSFSQNEGYDMAVDSPMVFGDIVVSLDTVRRQAHSLQIAYEEELKRVVVHGILHLLGMDHQGTELDQEPMLRKQEELLSEIAEVRLF